jgi:hypothetical protein
MDQFGLDLFGEIVVTIDEVEYWLDHIVKFCGTPWRSAHYALWWNVADKIRAAKIDGTWKEWIDGQHDNLDFACDDRRTCLRLRFGLECSADDGAPWP